MTARRRLLEKYNEDANIGVIQYYTAYFVMHDLVLSKENTTKANYIVKYLNRIFNKRFKMTGKSSVVSFMNILYCFHSGPNSRLE